MTHSKIYFPPRLRSKGLGIDFNNLSLSTSLSKEDSLRFNGSKIRVTVDGYGCDGKCEVLRCQVTDAPEELKPLLKNHVNPNIVLSVRTMSDLIGSNNVWASRIKPYDMEGILEMVNKELEYCG